MFSNSPAKLALLAALALTTGSALAHAQTTAKPAPATQPAASQPATPPHTPEQQKILASVHAVKIDTPFPKIDTKAYNKDNTPNPNFGQIQPGFKAAHESFLKRKSSPIGVLFLGDSITAGWGSNAIWKEHYAKLDAANFGIGGDRTEHVLWRIENGELDGISPKVVILMIGTNNSASNSVPEITAAVTAIAKKINEKLPDSKLLLLAIFPRNNPSTIPVRAKLAAVNAELAKLDDGKKTFYLDIGKSFLQPDGSISKDVMNDALHPTAKGYQIWADAMQAKLDELLK